MYRQLSRAEEINTFRRGSRVEYHRVARSEILFLETFREVQSTRKRWFILVAEPLEPTVFNLLLLERASLNWINTTASQNTTK